METEAALGCMRVGRGAGGGGGTGWDRQGFGLGPKVEMKEEYERTGNLPHLQKSP